MPRLHPAERGWVSDRLVDAPEEVLERCVDRHRHHLRDRHDAQPESGVGPIRTLEFSLKHALRVPFLVRAFPEAKFIVVQRDRRQAVSSLVEAWSSRRFVTYPSLPEWDGPPWSFPLVDGWRQLRGLDLLELAVRQWVSIDDTLLDDVSHLPGSRWTKVDLNEFLEDPGQETRRLGAGLGLTIAFPLPAVLPLTRSTLSAPDAQKWSHANPRLASIPQLASGERVVAQPIVAGPTGAGDRAHPFVGVGVGLFESSYSASIPELLAAARRSVMVSTYQSGRLICLREEAGELDTHFRIFDAPMGIACSRTSLVVASRRQIHDHQNHPGAAATLAPPAANDAYYLPRNSHVTGDIGVHEIVQALDGLWVVSTRFSCLATLDPVSSFIPRWKPRFVSKLAAEDRCHLNGVGVREERVRYVTALGPTDSPGGWREGKGHSGLVIDLSTGDAIAEGLSMPHSPRWYDGRVWVLESGKGALSTIDPDTGGVEAIATLPGFTRGLAFTGRIAWVGLSQVRESVFRGLPVSSRPERACGVWAVDIDTGETLGWVKFQGIVQEIFDVQTCPWLHPAIAHVGEDAVGHSFSIPSGLTR
jgi:uncharacterized protein (TIGR03032 family)